jgi:hypothetical protein
MTSEQIEPAPYARAWREYQRRLVFFAVTWIGGWAGGFVAMAIARSLTRDRDVVSHTFSVSAAIWIVSFFVTGVRFFLWRCPRCHKVFSGYWRTTYFAEKCAHCGLRKNARSPDGMPLDP